MVYNSLSDLEKIRQAAYHDDIATLQKLNILTNKQWVDEVIFRALFNRSYSILIWLTEKNIRINWNGIPKINWEGVPNDERMTYIEGLPLYQLPFRRYRQICDDEFINFVLESVAKTINSTEPLTKLLCIFTSLAYSDELLRRTHALGAELSEVVKFEGGDNAFMEDTYPLLVAIESEKIENIECLLELGATIPQGLDTAIDPVKYITENYLAAERKKALKVLKKYGFE